MSISAADYENYLPLDMFLKAEEIVNKESFNYEREICSLHITDKNVFDDNNRKDITIDNPYRPINISSSLLRDLISNEGMNKYMLYVLNRDYSNSISIKYYNKDTKRQEGDPINITKRDLVLSLMEYTKNDTVGDRPITNFEKNMLKWVLFYVNNNLCLDHYKNLVFSCKSTEGTFEMNSIDIINLLLSNEKEYKKGISNGPYPKDVMAFILFDFCNTEELLDKYLFDDYVYKRYEDIKEYRVADFQHLKKVYKSDDKKVLDEFRLDPEFYHNIIDEIPSTYDPLEKAMYVYIRLCDLLTYDKEQYASTTKIERKGIHKNIEDICSINFVDNEVVSYEFILIYAKILNELGINYYLNLNSMYGYTDMKSTLNIKHGEYLVVVDLFKDIIESDMTMVKIGGVLTGIRSENDNKVTYDKFNEKLYNIYSNYKDMEYRKQRFNEDVLRYQQEYQKDMSISKKERLYLLFKIIGRKDLKGIDSISYINKVFHNIFNDDENVSINVLGTTHKMISRPIAIVTLKEEDYTYFYIDPNAKSNTVKTISRNELMDMVEKHIISFIDNKVIPGITGEENSYVRQIKR